ncbi:MAG: tetratricopeptide repeat protein [Verrucomicrobiales bacterium]|nr:tetratricopeptide repeat protein [Verrucomicrobiales bacterium]
MNIKKLHTHSITALAASAVFAGTIAFTPVPAGAQGFLSKIFKGKKEDPNEIATVNPPGAETPAPPAEADKVKPNQVLSSGQLSAQEAAASQVLARAQQQESNGSYGKAYNSYKSIVKSYPRTRSAAEAQYKMGEMKEADGERKKAFDEYNKLITLYKNSSRYSDALNRQFAIADYFRTSEKKGRLGGIGAEIQPSRLILMFQQIADSAPYTEFAPRSLLNVGYIHSKQGEFPLAIMSFQQVADNYPNTEFATEAQYQVFKLRGKMADKSFSPVEDRAQEEAGMDFVAKNDGDARASDVKAELGQIEDRKIEKLFNVGRFYEKQGQLNSAAVYYREIVNYPGSSRYDDAKQRLDAIKSTSPTVSEISENKKDRPGIQLPDWGGGNRGTGNESADADGEKTGGLKKIFGGLGRKNKVEDDAALHGPPPPTIETRKPAMRTGGDEVIPIPSDDPVAAPTTAPVAPVAPGATIPAIPTSGN